MTNEELSMTSPLSLDPFALSQRDRYKLLIGLVIPRPIALVTTLGPTDIVNAAPFSFFNMFSETPPLCVLGLQCKHDGGLKDTSAHIRDRGAFVVNLVDEALGAQMNICAIDFPPEISEIDAAKLTLLPSEKITVPRIAEAPAALECRHYTTLEVSRERRLAIGEVVHIHVRPGIVDPEKLYVDLKQYRPLARRYGNFYASLGEPFTHVRQTFEQWQAGPER
jgi:flavin reductase (DIM6/NTAB) family NADH-FMN oxidoreductase RutF